MGARIPEAQCSSSCMRSRPWPEVALYVRAPSAAALTQVCSALCSDSTRTYCARSDPSATNSASFSTIVVWGVMGYAATT